MSAGTQLLELNSLLKLLKKSEPNSLPNDEKKDENELSSSEDELSVLNDELENDEKSLFDDDDESEKWKSAPHLSLPNCSTCLSAWSSFF